MASSTDSPEAVDDDIRRPYERYPAAETDEERHEIALEMGSSMAVVTQRSTRHSKTSNWIF